MIAARGLSRVLAKTSVYFDYGAATAYSVIDYPDEIAAATAQLSTNAAGFAHVTIRPLLTAEDATGIAHCCSAGCRRPGAGAFLVSISLLRQHGLLPDHL